MSNQFPPLWETLEAIDVEPTWATPKLMYPKILVDAALTALRARLTEQEAQIEKLRRHLQSVAVQLDERGRNARWYCGFCHQETSANGDGGNPSLIAHATTCPAFGETP